MVRTKHMNLDDYIDIASERLGGAAILANDEFFAPKDALVKPTPPVWREGEYTERGKWMDGWETRRRRTPGHDWCIIRLGSPGSLRAIVVDTSFFRGNYPEHCSVDGCVIDGHEDLQAFMDRQTMADQIARLDPKPGRTYVPPVTGHPDWFHILPKSALQGDSRNVFEIKNEQRITHLRLNIFPDGGVARLRAYGIVLPDWDRLRARGEIDLAAVQNGGIVVECSDMFFGHRHNLILPGSATHMGDGWETKRRRGPGHDWTIIKLGTRGSIHRAEVDTTHFKGNAPDSCMIEVCDITEAAPNESVNWITVLPRTPLQPHTRHAFEISPSPATHARFSIFPDGGVGRLRLYGSIASAE